MGVAADYEHECFNCLFLHSFAFPLLLNECRIQTRVMLVITRSLSRTNGALITQPGFWDENHGRISEDRTKHIILLQHTYANLSVIITNVNGIKIYKLLCQR